MPDEINPRTGQVYYAGSKGDIAIICKALNLDGGRLQDITDDTIYHYMDMVEQSIDGSLAEYYFTPIRPYNVQMPDGHIELTFPGKIRRLAQYWASGLLLQTEFQAIGSNTNETVNSYIEDSRKELYQITFYNQRIPGQRVKSAWSRTMPPTMQPAQNPEQNW